MVDYNAALPQLQQFQAPNMLAMASQANQMQLHQAQLAEVQRAAQEQNQLRSLLESGVDRNSPDFLKQVYRISPTMGMTLEKGQAELQNAALTRKKTEGELALQPETLKKAQAETVAANAKHLTEQLKNVLAYPDDARAAAAYGTLRSSAVQMHPEWDAVLPPNLDRKVLSQQVLTAEQAAQAQAAEKLANQPTVSTVAGMPPMIVNKGAGTFRMAQEAPSGGAPAAAGAQPFAASANTPAAVMRQPTAANVPVIGDAYLRNLNAAEGVDKNPRSTAQGFGQFINGTFVDTAKKVFPELANKSPAEILALRGTKLADGTPIEAALEQRFRTDNIASLTSAGIQPTPGNVYLAHFLGAGGARNVLNADPNTPLSQVVSADAIKANPEVLALKNKTVGDLQNWANSKFSGQPGLTASMTAGNARLGSAPAGFVPAGGAPMSLGAPTVNNALTANMFGAAPPQNAMLSLQPQIPGAPTPAVAMPAAVAAAPTVAPPRAPTTFAEAEAQRQARVAAQAGATTTATETAKATTAQETLKANKKEGAQLLLRTAGGENAKKIEDLIKASTSGLVEHMGAEIKGAIPSGLGGGATPGMQNIAQLDHIAKQMTFELLNGKLNAGVSNKDVQFIQGLVADIANPNKPAEERVAGFRQLKNTLEAWSSGKDVEIGAPATDKKTPASSATSFAVTTPDNKVHTFPSQEALNNFKRAAGL